MTGSVHLFNITQGSRRYSILLRRYDHGYEVEMINGFSPDYFPESVTKSALARFHGDLKVKEEPKGYGNYY